MSNYIPFIVYMAIAIVAICLATSKKARCLFAAVVLCAVVFAGVFALHGAARAEDDIVVVEIKDYVVRPVTNSGDLELEIAFGFNGNMLAFYWEGELDTSVPLMITIWLPELECIDATYAERR